MRRIRHGNFMNLVSPERRASTTTCARRPPTGCSTTTIMVIRTIKIQSLRFRLTRCPRTQTSHHHSVDDRIAYDAIHGAGSYDEVYWKAQMQASVNQDGGYYDQEGQWQDVNGIFDEEGTFYNFDEGYFDEQGNWILYPQSITGTLDFMV